MKLLRCRRCGDIFNLVTDRIKMCSCLNTCGQYDEDGLNAWCDGPCDLLGISNKSMFQAEILNIANPPGADALGHKFDTFFIPEAAPTLRRSFRVKEVDNRPLAS